MPSQPTTQRLYGVPHSLYTGIARCYLRTQGIAYTEVPNSDADFSNRILPAIQRSIIPVLETPQGVIVQDSLDIIDYFEQQGVPYSAYPDGLLQRVLSVIIAYYGTQAMLPHAMHYRWTYRDQQEVFLRDQFAAGAGEAMADKIMSRMNAYLPQLGVDAHTIPEIEASYLQLLDTLNAHFSEHPYLFGGRPSLADYGLIGPMFAHLGRDPVPANIMKTRAPKVFRWVERMTAPGLDTPEFPGYGDAYVADDAIPTTLEPLLRQIAERRATGVPQTPPAVRGRGGIVFPGRAGEGRCAALPAVCTAQGGQDAGRKPDGRTNPCPPGAGQPGTGRGPARRARLHGGSPQSY